MPTSVFLVNLTRRHVLLMMWIGAFLNLAPMPAEAAVRHIYLTWSGDPASLVRINVHTMTTPDQYRWASTSTHIDPIEALPGARFTVCCWISCSPEPGTTTAF